MKKHTLYSFIMAFAMLFTFTGFTACGDDDPSDPTPPPSGNKITSGTLYILEGYMPSTFDWVDYKTSIEKAGDADNYVDVTTDGLVDSEHLNFVSGDAKAVLLASIRIAFVRFSPLFRVTSKAVTTFPASFTLKQQATVKAELTEKPDFGYGNIYMFVDNNGKAYTNNASTTYLQGVRTDKAQDYLNKNFNKSSTNITVSIDNNQVTIK